MHFLSWLGQLVSGRLQPPADPRGRLWVRLPARRAADDTPGRRARVQFGDLSRSGVRLVLPEPVEVGDFLSIEVPGLANATLLACVVHVRQLGDDCWEAGCSFAAEIHDEDLRQLADGPLPLDPTERRQWQRAASNKEVNFQVVGAVPPKWEVATVLDVSAGGAALRVGRPQELRAVLRLELCGGDWQSASVWLASVVRVAELEDGGWLLGCNFTRELDEEELAALLDDGTD